MFRSSFIYDIKKDKWYDGPDLPNERTFAGHQAVNYQDTVIIMGGFNGEYAQRMVYQANATSNLFDIRPETLTQGRREFVAFEVPRDIVDC